MNSKYDLTGKKFERLTVIKRVENSKSAQTRWLCKCDCGNEVIVWGCHLRSGHTRSCGCIHSEQVKNIKHYKKHGLRWTRLYRIWNGIKNRCNENGNSNFCKYYSKRGIKVCDEWKNFENFYEWAINNGYADNLTIDRINVNGNYEPNNCRWVSMLIQQNNKRNNIYIEYNNEVHTLTEWNRILKLPNNLLANRLYRGWNIEKAFNTKVKGR